MKCLGKGMKTAGVLMQNCRSFEAKNAFFEPKLYELRCITAALLKHNSRSFEAKLYAL